MFYWSSRPPRYQRSRSIWEIRVQAADPKQDDVLLCGDFNTPVNKKEWDDLKSLPSMTHLLTKDDKTTLNKAKGRLSKNQYDTCWFQTSASTLEGKCPEQVPQPLKF